MNRQYFPSAEVDLASASAQYIIPGVLHLNGILQESSLTHTPFCQDKEELCLAFQRYIGRPVYVLTAFNIFLGYLNFDFGTLMLLP